jgi:antitoxin component YwqK of YwqJK toxin-antitoxin module
MKSKLWVLLIVFAKLGTPANGQLNLCNIPIPCDSNVWVDTSKYFYNFFTDSCESVFKIVPDLDTFTVGTQEITTLLRMEEKPILLHCEINDCIPNGKIIFKDIEADKIILTGTMKAGVPVGEFTMYGEWSTTIGFFTNGLLNGEVVTFLPKSIVTEQYKNGVLDGTRYESRNGKILGFINYKNGLKNGEERRYYESDMLWYSLTFKEGKLADGIYYFYRYEGEVYKTIKVEGGEVQTIWNWDE